MFFVKQLLHSDFNQLLQAEMQNDKKLRQSIYEDLEVMGEEQLLGVVRNSILSSIGNGGKFWAMESYKRNLVNTTEADMERSKREKARLDLTKVCAKCSLAHKKKDFELAGQEIDESSEECQLLLNAESAYEGLMKVEEIRNKQCEVRECEERKTNGGVRGAKRRTLRIPQTPF